MPPLGQVEVHTEGSSLKTMYRTGEINLYPSAQKPHTYSGGVDGIAQLSF